MALLRHLKVVLLILTLCIEHHHGAMFKLHMVKIYQNALDAEAHCKQLRFDGLAVLSSPEAYRNAIRMTEPYREVANFYIGLHFIPDTERRTGGMTELLQLLIHPLGIQGAT